ncbi:hypothetical protein S4054249_08690 [Pseudoalteromonas luteoviolacea]|uniref:Uncharacterized protein n=1 Tax=Pseudoalteromonas luteoviolacea S4054 TaxID=1129367 RepID=A0A0F6AHZ5_9GAMM|nr:hypothetical protein S4054249_08690 [Pseudoalteromonas luteoviolacea]AOT12830.1 hypothetical protein S40542_08690 [Pseudoalteromonas luteoviolacea]AOT17743.1 hypothetical protein S4054_08685 [Pseudoalteromonas luteoviolacea]KKE85845.1 hypothetical protein N479_00295 [Pseudoalteromonas luteoviolacea S4054]KZN74723.1 hypothetical protein N481_08675 [Pseudoalteromonas luteoviolacea S4047-1]
MCKTRNEEPRVIDLRSYQCPQLFVQFKWQLKSLSVGKLRFIYSDKQDMSDIQRYLCAHSYHHVFLNKGSFNYIEVHVTDV